MLVRVVSSHTLAASRRGTCLTCSNAFLATRRTAPALFHRTFFSPPSPPPPEIPAMNSAGRRFMPVVKEEAGALRRRAFSSPKNDAEAYTTDQLIKNASKLEGNVVLITGAGTLKGFGGQFALAAARCGAKVVVSDINEEGLVQVVKEIEMSGGQATSFLCDITDWDSQVRMFKHASRVFGGIDVVVASAGVGEDAVPLLDETETDLGEPAKPLLKSLHVNLIGTIYTAKLAFYHLRRSPNNGSKSFIAFGSPSSFSAPPNQPLYGASHHGVLGLCKSLHYDGLENGINVNCVVPWSFDTFLLNANVAALKEIPEAQVGDVVGAMIRAATTEESGKTLLVDERGVFSLPHTSSGYLSEGHKASTE